MGRLFVFSAMIAVCASMVRGQETAAETAISVTVAEARVLHVAAAATVAGTVVPWKEALVTPLVSGQQIIQVLVEEGDWVDSGDVVVRLRGDLLEAQLAQARAAEVSAQSAIRQAKNQIASTQAALTQAESEMARYQRLLDSGSVSQAAYDEVLARALSARASAASAEDGQAMAEAQAAQAQASLHVAELNLSWTQITAPVSGIVGVRNAKIGSLTGASPEPLLTLIEGGTLELSAEVIETALSDLKPGQGGSVRVAGIDRPLIALVRHVAPTVDPLTRLGEVRITLEGHAGLRSGLFASGAIVTEERDAVTVPITAVLTDADGAYVQVVRDGVVERRAVQPDLIFQGQREIRQGLEPGEMVIARAGAFFRDGDVVRPIPVEAGAGQ